MNFPETLKYTEDHEWLRVEGDYAYIGITDFAQDQLGDIVYVEVDVEEGEVVPKEEEFGTVEAVKTTSALLMPITGEILEINSKLDDEPELINKDSYGDGWIIKIKILNQEELKDLLDVTAYKDVAV